MRKTLAAIYLAFALFALAGCGGGTTRGVTMDKTIAHKGGIFNMSQTQHVGGKVEARAGGNGEWTDVTAMKSKDFEAWMKGKSNIEARSFVAFDDFQLPLENKSIEKAGQIEDMQKYVNKRMNDVNDFMKNNNKQLNAKDW